MYLWQHLYNQCVDQERLMIAFKIERIRPGPWNWAQGGQLCICAIIIIIMAVHGPGLHFIKIWVKLCRCCHDHNHQHCCFRTLIRLMQFFLQVMIELFLMIFLLKWQQEYTVYPFFSKYCKMSLNWKLHHWSHKPSILAGEWPNQKDYNYSCKL